MVARGDATSKKRNRGLRGQAEINPEIIIIIKVYLQLHRVGFTYTYNTYLHITCKAIQMRRYVTRNVIHTHIEDADEGRMRRQDSGTHYHA